MMEGESQSTESSPVFFPPACGKHTRCRDESRDSDQDSVLVTEEDGINGEPKENFKSVLRTGDDVQDWKESRSTAWEGKTFPRRYTTNRNSQIFYKESNTKQNNCSSEKVKLPGMKERMSTSVIKYWFQRYDLFSKYEEGVKLDEEVWFSVTPEVIAEQQARRCPTGLIVDGFTGVGILSSLPSSMLRFALPLLLGWFNILP